MAFKSKYLTQNQLNLKTGQPPKNVKELEAILEKVNGWNLCLGGPDSTYCANENSRVAYKDGLKWRHNDCDFVLETGNMCAKCCSVYTLLNDSVRRRTLRFNRMKQQRKLDKSIRYVTISKKVQKSMVNPTNQKTSPRTKKYIQGLRN